MTFPERPLMPPFTEDDFYDHEPLPAHLRERDPDEDYDEQRQRQLDRAESAEGEKDGKAN